MITEGYLARHHMGRRGMKGPAMLDVAQDYLLAHLDSEGIFETGVILKGGTSLRKFRAGNSGRFSTDLDFAVPDVDVADLLFDLVDGAAFEGVHFSLGNRSGLRANLRIDTDLGRPEVDAKIEASVRPIWLPTETLDPISLPVHRGYEFALPRMPAPALEEALAEKLAAWRRRRKMRDLYDLYWFGQRVLNEPLIRRILVLKVWHDVVDDGLGQSPFDARTIIEPSEVATLPPEDIGLLTQPVDPAAWFADVQKRYAFVTELDEDESTIALCNPGHRWKVEQLIENL